MKRIKDIDKIDRPREKLAKKGSSALSDIELLQALIGSGSKNAQNKKVVHQMGHLFVTNDIYEGIENYGVGDQLVIFEEPMSDHLPIIADIKN